MNMINCNFCKKDIDKSNIKRHQKTSKKCIDMQKSLNIEPKIKHFICNFCNKSLTSKNNLAYHLNICKAKKGYEEEIEFVIEDDEETIEQKLERLEKGQKDLQEENKKLKDTIEKLSSTPSNITNNNNTTNIINIYPSMVEYITPERVLKVLNGNNITELAKDDKKLATLFVEEFFVGEGKTVYLCTDKDRMACYYYVDNKLVRDTDCRMLNSLLTTNPHPLAPSLKKRFNTRPYKRAFTNSLPRSIQERKDWDSRKPLENEHKIKLLENTKSLEQYLNDLQNFGFYRSNILEKKHDYNETGNISIPDHNNHTKVNCKACSMFTDFCKLF